MPQEESVLGPLRRKKFLGKLGTLGMRTKRRDKGNHRQKREREERNDVKAIRSLRSRPTQLDSFQGQSKQKVGVLVSTLSPIK